VFGHWVLTLGFARRFATYKRATLIFHDFERLLRMLGDRWQPLQIVFAAIAGGIGNLLSHMPSDMRLKEDICCVGTLFDGTPVYRYRYKGAPAFHIGLMAQDRRDTLLLDHSIAENIALASLARLTPHGFLDLAALRRLAADYVAQGCKFTDAEMTRVASLPAGVQRDTSKRG